MDVDKEVYLVDEPIFINITVENFQSENLCIQLGRSYEK
jgi:hypothetical protein